MDVLDGVLARETGKVSPFGGFFDSVADRYSDAVVLSSITASGLCHPAWGLTALVGSLMVSYSRARAEAAGVKMIAVGFAERAERMLLLIASTWGAFWRIEGLGWGITLLAVLSNLTVVQRSIHFYKRIRTS
jgi:archaetidylinositol phosphate synthase